MLRDNRKASRECSEQAPGRAWGSQHSSAGSGAGPGMLRVTPGRAEAQGRGSQETAAETRPPPPPPKQERRLAAGGPAPYWTFTMAPKPALSGTPPSPSSAPGLRLPPT